MFTPGLGLGVAAYTTLREDLASQGYVVAAVNPTYSTPVVLDGRAVPAVARAGDDADPSQLALLWAGDMRFVAGEMDSGVAAAFAGRLQQSGRSRPGCMRRASGMQANLHWATRDEGGLPDPVPLPPATERHPAPAPPPLATPDGDAGPAAPPNRLYFGDNLAVMAGLRPELEGRIDLIYVDPPFGSQDRYVLRRGGAQATAYVDRWSDGLVAYLDMLLPRLRLMHALLSPRGALYVHLDATAAHYVKVLLDEIFGPGCFQREIIWRIGWVSGYKSTVRNWVRNHDTILYYTKDPRDFTFNKAYVPHPPGYARRGGREGPGRPIEDVWNANVAEQALSGEESLDSIQIKSFSGEKTGFETQKNLSLLRRIVAASSHAGDLVADFFCGSGTTLVAAEGLDRRWLGCDAGEPAIQVTRDRLLALPERRAFEVTDASGLAAPPRPATEPAGPAPAGDASPEPEPPAPATWVTDEIWAAARTLLPPEPVKPRGRPRLRARNVLSAVRYVQRDGGSWSTLPREYGSAQVIRARLREWRSSGVWERLAAAGLVAGGPGGLAVRGGGPTAADAPGGSGATG